MRKEVQEVLRGLTLEELREARALIEALLGRLEGSGAARARLPVGQEQRRSDRFSVNLPVTYFRHRSSPRGEAATTGVEEAVVRDISRGGIRFFTREALEPPEILTIYLPGPLGIRKLFVEVSRSESRGDQFECGAAFVGLDRLLSAQKAEEQRSEAVQVLVACEPCPARDALGELLLRQGFMVHMANSVPEAASMLSLHRCSIVLAAAPLLLAEGQRLLNDLAARGDDVLSIALVSTCDLDSPDALALRACHDFIAEPDRAQEVRVVVGRTFRRLMAARARKPGAAAP